MNKTITNWHLIPFISILAFPLFIEGINRGSSRYFIAFFISIIIALAIRLLFNIRPFIFILLSLPVLFMAINYDVLAIDYHSFINITTWAVLFETNKSEAFDFIASTSLLTKSLVITQVLIYIFYLIYLRNKTIKSIKTKYKYYLIALLALLTIDYSVKGATKIAFPIRGLHGLYNYIDTKITEARYLKIKKNAKFNATRDSDFLGNQNETIIIVVGESLRRDHLEYYGYHRATTPFLKKDSLIIFKDVISPANQTINSLKRIFTSAELLNDNDYWKSPSFIKAFKEVGFKTYWITAQPVYGRHESEASFIGEESDSFIATHMNFSGYDEDVLPELRKVLREKEQKKVILIHIMGSHAAYYKRYPKKFEHFPRTKDKRQALINLYDNSVLYNDYFLHQVLNELKSVKGQRSFMMFSDHGESLFDTPNFAYHGSGNPSKSEYNIPLVLWFSGEFKQAHPNIIQEIIANRNKPIVFSDAFHAIPSLYGIQSNRLKISRNFFGKAYQTKKKRSVVNLHLQLLDYDKLP